MIDFKVECIRHNKKDELKVSWWEYRIISKLSEEKVKELCVKKLVPIDLEKNKKNLFTHELVQFNNITKIKNSSCGNMYSYIVKKEATI